MVEKLPKSIVKAICEIKKSLEAVSKTQKNSHGGYMFASTDDIYAALTRKMGQVGLVIMALEDKCEIVKVEKDGKTVQWAHFEFSFVLATDEDTWSDERAKRTLYIQVTGPQTFQAAQSYAEKSYMRSLFKTPTGDMDLDSMPQAETEEGQAALNGNGGKRKSSAAAKRDGTDKLFNEIKQKIETAESLDMLEQLPDLYADEIATLPRHWNELIQHTYEDRAAELRQ
ncbi:ERF family protein [Hyphomicrobium sp. DMF-1]|uniref:ERF family protein n=1 Tax=Hyphomicrobium sp. DMF-1 TaxID=3019544 RepID=UPI0022EBE3F6|nr:ERF family protein [Hyphomicrobium sp. DMF-1]WBT40137.1 ERF family protein [Hyphomicrobium sp. DMF-1]